MALFDSTTPYSNGRGGDIYQLFQKIPALRPFYTPFEADYITVNGAQFTQDHWEIPLTCIAIYLLGIIIGSSHMKDVPYDKIWNLRGSLALWNALLCAFSLMGALRTVPHLAYNLATQPFVQTICTPPDQDWGCGATGFWVQLFIFSKIPELVDTFFIVARKRPLIFLHWYHHVTVLLYCWHSYATEAPQSFYFVAMNYTVHAIMYGYYCLMALKIKPPVPPVFITILQLTQMVVGTAVQVVSLYLYNQGTEGCTFDKSNLTWGGIMYGSYFLLFFKFALDRFVFKKSHKPAAESKDSKKRKSKKAD